MLLGDLVDTSRRIGATSARSEKLALLAELLRRLEPEEVEIAVAFLAGHLRQGRIGLGWSTIEAARAGAPASDASAHLVSMFETPVDAATVPDASDERATKVSLTLSEVDLAFERAAHVSGPGSTFERTRLLAELFRRATADETDFLMRLIMGELRQGALAGLMEEALARASGIPAARVQRALMLAGDLQAVARAALTEGEDGLARFRLQLLRPLRPMLAQTAQDVKAALERLGEAALEFKLDGARMQVHKLGAEVRVFSRQLNDVTAAVPELVEAVRALPARELILDGEAIALRPDLTPHPFQVTMRRFGRKLDVEETRHELPLTPFFFDLLRLDGQDLFDAPARDRFAALEQAAPGLVIPRLVTADLKAAGKFFDESLRRGHEGLMAKALDAPYVAGGRGFSWLKVKAAHTLDLVVLAAEWGHGRRAGRLSNIHLGARDPATGDFVMLGKTFKGMTDEMLEWQTQKFNQLALMAEGQVVHLRPELVVEVAFNDVQESPQYPAGMALRFARVKRYREDKGPLEADTIETVRAILEGGKKAGKKN